jgi:cytochrome b561
MTQIADFGRRYSSTAQLLHWSSALLVGGAWALGNFGDDLPKGSMRELGELIHVSAGQLIVALLLTRLVWRVIYPPPPVEATPLGRWADYGGRIMHFVLYALLAAVPIAGVVTLFASGDGMPLFGFGEIPSPWLRDKAFEHAAKEVHETLANALIILALLHAGAALAHHYYFKDRTLKRMLPSIFDAEA